MATRHMEKIRRKWDCNKKNGLWARSLGLRSERVLLFQKRKNGVFYAATWTRAASETKGRRVIERLGASDRYEAERLGRRKLGALLSGTAREQGPVLLGDLACRFERECADFLDNKPRSRAETAERAKILKAFFGEDFDVRRFTSRDQLRYTAARRAGGVVVSDTFTTRGVGARSVEADLVVLHQMLAWACTVPVGMGRWLDRHPLKGVRREREKNPRRPAASWERFVATRQAMHRLREKARLDEDHARERLASATRSQERHKATGAIARAAAAQVRWLKIELALVVAEAAGRRIGSIRALRWEDVSFESGRITWAPEDDKKGRKWVMPLTSALADELRQFQRQLGAIGGLMFPAEKVATQVMDRDQFYKWLLVAEQAAGLKKLDGSLWHAYRRKWATERMHLPIKAVADAGGWKDAMTLIKCYQQTDEATLLAVMAEPRKLSEAVGA